MRPLKNSNPDRKDLLLGLLLVLLVAVVYYAQWSLYLSEVVDSKVNIYTPQKYFWWADDSRDYRATGDWLFGKSGETFIELRPWLYPLWVGFFHAALGPNAETALWVSQVLMWLASIALLYLALYNSTKRPVLAILGSALFFSHPSALVLTFHGLTETLNILLLPLSLLFGAVTALRFGRKRSDARSRAAQLMVAMEEIVPSAAMAGSTAANGSGAIRESASSGTVGSGFLAKARMPSDGGGRTEAAGKRPKDARLPLLLARGESRRPESFEHATLAIPRRLPPLSAPGGEELSTRALSARCT